MLTTHLLLVPLGRGQGKLYLYQVKMSYWDFAQGGSGPYTEQ